MRKPETALLDRLLLSMQALLKDLIQGGEEARYLLFEGCDIIESPGLKELFIHRICRAMALIGYNIPILSLREKIVKMLQILKTTQIHSSFRRFAMARGWGGIVGAIQISCTKSHLDEMVQLCSTEKPHLQGPPLEGIRRVPFKKPQNIPLVLSTSLSDTQANPFIKGSSKLLEDAAAEMEQPAVVDSHDLQSLQKKKDLALRLLQKHRQRVRNKKLEQHKTTTQKACDSYFETCFKLAQESQWPCKPYYKKIYLGLVPHLLACVKGVESYAFSAKAEAKKRLRGDEKWDYDETRKMTNEMVAIIKGCKKLGSQLDPSSDVHVHQDTSGLKQLVREVEALVNRMPSGACPDIHFNLQLAIKGIITEPKRGGRLLHMERLAS
ncbi:hypothetical protein H1R20_g5905, partial [Candolleomyces eurysporus]